MVGDQDICFLGTWQLLRDVQLARVRVMEVLNVRLISTERTYRLSQSHRDRSCNLDPMSLQACPGLSNAGKQEICPPSSSLGVQRCKAVPVVVQDATSSQLASLALHRQ